MNNLHSLSFSVSNLKCFGESPQGLEHVKPINIIIGKNNSGKSTLLDVIKLITDEITQVPEDYKRSREEPIISCYGGIELSELRQVFPTPAAITMSNCPIDLNYGKLYVGKNLSSNRLQPIDRNNIFIEHPENISFTLDEFGLGKNYTETMAVNRVTYLQSLTFKRLIPERDINPEHDDHDSTMIYENGRGLTNLLQNVLHNVKYEPNDVKVRFLNELNQIVSPELKFVSIDSRKLGQNRWEIFLEEKSKGRIKLSQSGTGLKTIILVVAYLYLLPKIESPSLSNCVFGFEELENNLHPSLFRRLLQFISKQIVDSSSTVFITTHSNVAIDMFIRDENAQIVHVTHSDGASECSTVQSFFEYSNLLDDLGVRASDILQANTVIWLEGPSDRVYVNRWIDLWTEGQLKEGTHYQCVFYGGKVLSHFDGQEPDNGAETVAMLRLNKNAIVMMDSDKKKDTDSIGSTKQRVIQEIETSKGIAWLTKGREIENFIPASAVDQLFELSGSAQVGEFDNFFEHLDSIKPDEGRKWRQSKPKFARQIAPFLSRENIAPILDLSDRLDELTNYIKETNGLT